MIIFGRYAPSYWAKGLSVIPLLPCDKKTFIPNWSSYSHQLPDENTQANWLLNNADGNIGLVLGPQSGLVMVDVDTEDPKASAAIKRVLPATKWIRRGRKGAAYAFKFNGVGTFRVKDNAGNPLVEVLSTGTQLAIPPSIHPDTKMPYIANCELLDVVDDLPELPQDWEAIVRAALASDGIGLSHSGWTRLSEMVAVGSRDTTVVSHAGVIARDVTRGTRTLLDGLREMEHFCENLVEKVAGDNVGADKGKQRIIQFLTRDVMGKARLSLPRGWDAGLTPEMKDKLHLNFDKEHEEWGYDELKQHLVDEFTLHPRDSKGRADAVEYIIERVARSRNLSQLDEDRLLKWIADSSGLSMTFSSLKGQVRNFRQGEINGTDHSEIAAALLESLNDVGEVRYHNGEFWRWEGARWGVMREEELQKELANKYGNLVAAKKFSDHKGILGVMRALATKELCLTNEPGINFANGWLGIDGVLCEHHPNFGATYTLPYKYDAGMAGKCFRFLDFLHGIWGEDSDYEQKVQALREAIAATLFGVAPTFSRAMCLFGVEASGKSQIISIIAGLMPECSVSRVNPSDWGDKFLPTQMHDKLLNICGELSEDRFINGDTFKEIVEGAEINGQYKGKQIFKFRPKCAHWFATNHLPKTRDTSPGFTRRWLMLQFNKTVTLQTRVISIGLDILADEREAIAAWAVASIKDLIERKDYDLPESHQQLIGEVANINNTVRFFLTAAGMVQIQKMDPQQKTVGSSTENSITETQLYDEYYRFCIGLTGVKPVSSRTFRIRVRELAGSLKIKMSIRRNEMGLEYAVFENITLAAQEASRKLAGRGRLRTSTATSTPTPSLN